MQNKTLKDVLIDLYHSGDLVPVWDEDDTGRFVVDLIAKYQHSCGREVSDYYLSKGADCMVYEALECSADKIGELIEDPESLGIHIRKRIHKQAMKWAQLEDAWDEAKAHITELERSR